MAPVGFILGSGCRWVGNVMGCESRTGSLSYIKRMNIKALLWTRKLGHSCFADFLGSFSSWWLQDCEDHTSPHLRDSLFSLNDHLGAYLVWLDAWQHKKQIAEPLNTIVSIGIVCLITVKWQVSHQCWRTCNFTYNLREACILAP